MFTVSIQKGSVVIKIHPFFSVDCVDCAFYSVQDLKANESRLRDINKVASELESEGLMAEEAPMVQAQVTFASIENYDPRCTLNEWHHFFSLCSNKSCLALARLVSFLMWLYFATTCKLFVNQHTNIFTSTGRSWFQDCVTVEGKPTFWDKIIRTVSIKLMDV